MNGIELISAGVGMMGAAGIVWAIAHGAPQSKPQPVEPPHGDDWQWDRPYTQRTERDFSFLSGDFARSIREGHTESLPAYEKRLDHMNRTATNARHRYTRGNQ